MTEAELRRLAEIITKISARDARPVFDYWQLVIAFLGGIAVNSVMELIRRGIDRRAVLRISRASLYQNLERYSALLQIIRELGKTPAKEGPRDRARLEIRLDTVWEGIRDDLVSADDRKYSRLVADALFYAKSDTEQIEAVSHILRKLERDELPLIRRLEVEHLKALYREMVKDGTE